MKKKFWLIPIIIVVILVSLVVFAFIMNNKGLGISVGRYLEANNGIEMIVCGDSPIIMSADDNMFDGLETGDLIMIFHGIVLESYPAQTGVDTIIKLGNGTMNDISGEVVDTLFDLGWLE